MKSRDVLLGATYNDASHFMTCRSIWLVGLCFRFG